MYGSFTFSQSEPPGQVAALFVAQSYVTLQHAPPPLDDMRRHGVLRPTPKQPDTYPYMFSGEKSYSPEWPNAMMKIKVPYPPSPSTVAPV